MIKLNRKIIYITIYIVNEKLNEWVTNLKQEI